MIFVYKNTVECRKELFALLSAIREKDGEIVTLSVGRVQGMQYGHKRLFDFAEEIGDRNLFGLGSCQAEGTFNNPFSPTHKIEMIRLVKGYDKRFSGKLSIIKLKDIGAVKIEDWKDYVLSSCKSHNLPKPNVYIGGSELDIMDNGFDLDPDILCISLDRLNSGIMSGTEVRKSIINGNSEWKNHVPFVLHSYIEEHFPKHLKLESQINS